LRERRSLNDAVRNPLALASMGMRWLFGNAGPLTVGAGQVGGAACTEHAVGGRPDVQFNVMPLSVDKPGDPLHDYPGFTAATGGLLREPGLMAQREAFDRAAWLAAQQIVPRPGEQLASLFCYRMPSAEALLGCLGEQPTLLLVPGTAPPLPGLPASIRVQSLPYLAQADFDRLLWACDLNFVRGEDSLVRALWAGKPFVWQIYSQDDGVHGAKLQAFLDRFAASPGVRAAWRAWNDLQAPAAVGPDRASWQVQCLNWRQDLLNQTDLAGQLLSFVSESL
jgi:uncharacterized repeat protein (TIGR03837 family)